MTIELTGVEQAVLYSMCNGWLDEEKARFDRLQPHLESQEETLELASLSRTAYDITISAVKGILKQLGDTRA